MKTLLLCLLLYPLSLLGQEWETVPNAAYDEDEFTDGDSIPIVTPDDQFIINLYFIDAPETNDRYADKINEQAEYWGRSVEDTVAAGKAAGKFVANALTQDFEVHTKRSRIPGGTTTRYYGMIKIGDRYLSEILVEAGLARVRGKTEEPTNGSTTAAFLDKLRTLETQAIQKKRGAFGEGPIEINPPVVAVTQAPQTASGILTLRDEAIAFADDGSYKPLGTLKPGRKIKIVDEDAYLRVLIAVPGKKPVPALIKQKDIK